MIAEASISWPGAITIIGIAFAMAAVFWAGAYESARKNRYKDD